MNALRRFLVRALTLATGRNDRRLAAEIEDHIARQTEEYIRSGLSPLEARRQATLKFGGVQTVREAYRDQQGLPFLDSLSHDVRYAARGLVRSPGFTLLAVLCLALGVGINSTVFSIADTVSMAPLPFDDPDRLVQLYSIHRTSAPDRGPVSYQDYRDWREEVRSFSSLPAHSYRSLSITEGVESERFQGSAITWSLFPMLGVHPALGRPFAEADDRAGAAPVVMMSHGLWQRRYASEPSIVGRMILVNGMPHTVIGVMPERFQFPQVAELWVPLTPLEHASPRGVRTVYPIGRLADGVTIASADSEIAAVAARLAREHRENESWSARAVPLRDELMPESLRIAMRSMLGAVSLVLAIACANVANLLLARATGRQREMAIRTALGAGRARLVRQLLTESVMLGLLSAPLGLLMAYAGLEAMLAAVPSGLIIPYYVDWTVNARVVVYTTSVAVITGLLFGMAPAFRAGRSTIGGVLNDGGRGAAGSRPRNRLRSVLVVAEVALSLVLLVGASMFVRSMVTIYNSDPGFDPDSMMTLRMFMPGESYATTDARTARIKDIVSRVEALPGVTAAFAADIVPLAGSLRTRNVVVDGTTIAAEEAPAVSYIAGTSHLIEALDQRLIAGRDFTDAEAATRSGMAIVNREMASRVWPGRTDIIGSRFRFATDAPDTWFTVIGLVSDFKPLIVRWDVVPPLAILPFPYQEGREGRDVGLTIRVAGIPTASVTSSVRRAIGQSDSTLALFDLRTVAENREARMWGSLFLTWMFSIFGGTALFLAAIGIYGVLSYSVAQRAKEFGVRVALGATRRNILGLVATQGLRLAASGIVIGSLGAFMITRVLQSLLYVDPQDPVSFGGSAIVLTAVTVLAGYVPALRATMVDPITVLRAE